jgi:hypothetical protein
VSERCPSHGLPEKSYFTAAGPSLWLRTGAGIAERKP